MAYIAFLSSLMTGLSDIRRRIYELGQEIDRPVWVAEHVDKTLAAHPGLEIADTCIENIRLAPLFIVVLTGKHGSKISIGDKTANVSYFEIELYQAALLQKPVHVFATRDFSPDAQLRELLRSLSFSYDLDNVKRDSEKIILKKIRRLLLDYKPHEHAPVRFFRRTEVSRLTKSLASLRDPLFRRKGSRKGDFRYLNGAFIRPSATANLDLAQSLISEARGQKIPDLALARLWIAIRELMGAPYNDRRHGDARPLWREALGLWAKSGAWYGLHGHVYLGCLAAWNSIFEVHRYLDADDQKLPDAEDRLLPIGGLSSAYYSIGKRIRGGKEAKAVFTYILDLLGNDAIDSRPDRLGLVAIRGSTLMQLHRHDDAVDDYQTVLDGRIAADMGPASIGEAMSELGHALLFVGRTREGLDLMRQGAALLREHGSPGFLARALRKLGLGLLRTGRVLEGLDALREAYETAQRYHLRDQIGPELAMLARVLGWDSYIADASG